MHRENYHSKNAIACELAWLRALGDDGGVITPRALHGADGEHIQTLAMNGLENRRHAVLFEFIEGEEPDETQDLVAPFERLGEVTAKLHLHSLAWTRPRGFERLTWDYEHILGETPHWGDWRQAPAMDAANIEVLSRQQQRLRKRLESYGTGRHRFGLVHADLRLANLLVNGNSTRVIDFDDCGFGWLLYDLATAFSFFEDHPQVPALVDAWLKGYRRLRPLAAGDEAEIQTFIMLRRMALLAWIGSHSETDLAREQGPEFTRVSCELAERYLSGH